MRERYNRLLAEPAQLELVLRQGAAKARAEATPFAARLRHAVGLRALDDLQKNTNNNKKNKTSQASFKQYREADGRFFFKLVDHKGKPLLISPGFSSHQEAALAMASLLGTVDDLQAVLLSKCDQLAKPEELHLALEGLKQHTDA